MSTPKDALSDSLYHEAVPHNDRRGARAPLCIALIAGIGIGALLGKSSGNWITQKSAISLALQSVQAGSLQSIKPPQGFFTQPQRVVASQWSGTTSVGTGSAKAAFSHRNELLRTSALAKRSAFPGPSFAELGTSGVIDVRDSLRRYSPANKCIYVDKHASLCGNLVVLRPSTALRATTSGKSKLNADDLVKDLSTQFDSIDAKPEKALYAGGAVVALVVLNGIVASIESIPILPKLFEIVGAGYSAYFAFRYLLNKDSRAELIADIEKVKDQVF